MQLDEIAETFDLLGDWEQRYQYLIELGEELPAFPESLQKEENRVKACMSKVWLVANAKDGKIYYEGECDTAVIKGVLALLIGLCNGKTSEQIDKIDMDEIFRRLNLDEHLSPNRHVGVYAMFDLMKQKARVVQPSTQPA